MDNEQFYPWEKYAWVNSLFLFYFVKALQIVDGSSSLSFSDVLSYKIIISDLIKLERKESQQVTMQRQTEKTSGPSLSQSIKFKSSGLKK